MSIDWVTVEAALQDWVESGSGLADGQVIFAAQNGPRPAKPLITIRLELGPPVGLDGLVISDTDGAPAGQEITRTSRGLRNLTVDLQAFSDAARGTQSPMALLEAVASRLSLQTQRDALGAANLGLISIGSVSRVDGVVNSTTFEPRAILSVRFLVTSETAEELTYIETVEVTDEIAEPDNTFDVTIP